MDHVDLLNISRFTWVYQFRVLGNWLHYILHKYKNDVSDAKLLPTFKVPETYLSFLFRVLRSFRDDSFLMSFQTKVFTNN